MQLLAAKGHAEERLAEDWGHDGRQSKLTPPPWGNPVHPEQDLIPAGGMGEGSAVSIGSHCPCNHQAGRTGILCMTMALSEAESFW